MNKRKKIVISGWYGPGNVGDEAILYSIKQEMLRKYEDCDITVMSFRPKRTRLEHNMKAVFQLPQNFKSFVFSILTLRLFKTLFVIKNCDLFILGGGGFLSDRVQRTPKCWLFHMKIAKFFNKETLLYKIGAGPFYSAQGKNETKYYIDNYVDEIIVRDLFSYKELVENVKISNENIRIEIDPVAEADFSKLLEMVFDKKSISVIYTPFYGIKQLKDNQIYNELKLCFKAQADILLEKNEKVQFLFFQPKIEQDLFYYLKNIYNDRVDYQFVNSFAEGINIINKSKAVISFRLHGNIIAHNFKIPFLPIIYHFKTTGFLMEAGYNDDFCKIDITKGVNISEWSENTHEFLTKINEKRI